MDDITREYIAELKQAEPFTGHLVPIGDTGEMARVQFLGRGEMAFYQEGERALLAEVLVGPAVIGADSIRRWDTGKKVTEAEREAIIERISIVLMRMGAKVVYVPPRGVDRKYLEKLREQDPSLNLQVPIGDTGQTAHIRFGVRDGLAFYQEGERALLLDARVETGVIRAASIKRWDDGVAVGEAERAGIIERVTTALRQAGAGEVTVV